MKTTQTASDFHILPRKSLFSTYHIYEGLNLLNPSNSNYSLLNNIWRKPNPEEIEYSYGLALTHLLFTLSFRDRWIL